MQGPSGESGSALRPEEPAVVGTEGAAENVAAAAAGKVARRLADVRRPNFERGVEPGDIPS